MTMTTESGDLITHRSRYWEGASSGQLLIKRCRACQEHFFYPRPLCPFCTSHDTEWVAACGRGTIYSFSLMRRKGEVVFAPAFVTLEEGPTILTGLVGALPESYRVGQRVEVTFAPTKHHPSTPLFKPAEARPGEV